MKCSFDEHLYPHISQTRLIPKRNIKIRYIFLFWLSAHYPITIPLPGLPINYKSMSKFFYQTLLSPNRYSGFINPFRSMISFYIPCKRQQTFGFLFSGGTERENGMKWIKIYTAFLEISQKEQWNYLEGQFIFQNFHISLKAEILNKSLGTNRSTHFTPLATSYKLWKH